MAGYWRDRAETARVMRDGWLKTGDIAFLDEQGRCSIVDRAKDMIISAGENIYCIEIEDALAQHPDVIECAVIAAPHAVFGEQPVAIVRLVAEACLNADDLRQFLRKSLAPSKIPSRVEFQRDTLPRNSMGKIEKKRLKQAING